MSDVYRDVRRLIDLGDAVREQEEKVVEAQRRFGSLLKERDDLADRLVNVVADANATPATFVERVGGRDHVVTVSATSVTVTRATSLFDIARASTANAVAATATNRAAAIVNGKAVADA